MYHQTLMWNQFQIRAKTFTYIERSAYFGTFDVDFHSHSLINLHFNQIIWKFLKHIDHKRRRRGGSRETADPQK